MPPVSTARFIAPTEIIPDGEYSSIAASTAATALGASGGAKGDVLFGLVIVPTTTVGTIGVQIKDGANTAITVAPAGTYTVAPIWIPLNILSTNGAWQVATGTGVAVIAVGKFT